jgi:Caspase domain
VRRALIVGIDEYPFAPLAGCVNDATAMDGLLARNDDDSPNFDTRLVTAPFAEITRASLRADIQDLFKDEADVALFFFSGHGTENNLGGYLVTPDANQYDEGVPMVDVLAAANQSPAKEAVIIVDCCHSGALGQLPAINNEHANIREGVSILTASRSTQPAVEANGTGLFTSLVCAALAGGAADVLGKVTAASVYTYVDESLGAWDQRPLFKAHVSTLTPVRQAAPALDPTILRRLPEWFDRTDSIFALDPSFEPDAEPDNPGNEAIFACLQKCRAAKLVEPVDEDHMYFAAMNSTGCRLTPLGRHYWRLANEGRI